MTKIGLSETEREVFWDPCEKEGGLREAHRLLPFALFIANVALDAPDPP
jgi:hypothetical protein